MTKTSRNSWTLRTLAVGIAVALPLLGSGLTSRSAGDLQSSIAAKRSAVDSLHSAIAAETARIQTTTNGLGEARARLAAVQSNLSAHEAQLSQVQTALLAAREHLLELENRLQQAAKALSANLVANYEGARPDMMTVILEAHGFKQLLEQVSFLQRVGKQDALVVRDTKTARAAVFRQANSLAGLETRDRKLTDQILAQRNQVAALQAALLNRQIAELGSRANTTAQLGSLNAQLKSLEARAAREAAAAAAAANAANAGGPVGTPAPGGITVNTGGMVQPPPGAPAAIGQVMAAGNAIATLPYIWGGGHGSFHDSGYDCSGSVSYALAAAGLLSSPLDSTGFESWGDPGPGRWITVYANAGHAFMVVAGWRFDTVALAQGGTRWSQSMTDTSGFVARHPPGL
jgi:cell wall-associated NlpC family hydrolase